jgi:hypothetical protein
MSTALPLYRTTATYTTSIAKHPIWTEYAVAQLVEVPRYKPEGCGSTADGVIGIFH